MEKVIIEDLDRLQPLVQRAVNIIGVQAFVRLCAEFGGVPLYFPKIESVLVKARERVLLQEFDGYNYRELALKYGVSETWIRQIMSKDKMDKNSMSLFEETV